MTNRKLGLVILLLSLCILCTGCGEQYVITTGFQEMELLRIDGSSCFLGEFLIYQNSLEQEYQNAFGEEIWQQAIGTQTMEERLRELSFSRLVKVKMMALLAKEQDITLDTLEEDLANSAGEDYYNSLSPETLEKLGNLQLEDIQRMFREYALAKKVYDAIAVEGTTEISDDAARVVQVKQIELPFTTQEEKIKAQETAEEVYAQLLAGKSFDTAISEYSSSPEGNIILSIAKGQREAAVEQAVFQLSKDSLSMPVVGEQAVYLFYCVSAYDQQQVDVTKEQLMLDLKANAFQQVYEPFAREQEFLLQESLWQNVGEYSLRKQGIYVPNFWTAAER